LKRSHKTQAQDAGMLSKKQEKQDFNSCKGATLINARDVHKFSEALTFMSSAIWPLKLIIATRSWANKYG